jgi:hypothetical protein
MRQATYKGNVPCVLNQEFLFFVHEYWSSEVTRLGWSIGSYETSSTRKPCAKAVVPETDFLMQQKQYHKRTTLRTLKLLLQSICSKEGLHYRLGAKCKKAVIRQATNAIYGMGTLKIPLRSIRSEEGPHYRLGAKRKEAVIWQATINLFTSLDILWWFHTRAVLRSLANARKCQFEESEEERYESSSVQRTFTAETFGKRRKRENSTIVMLLPGSHERLASRNPRVLFQKHGGTCRMY